jgi:hypothetical protein
LSNTTAGSRKVKGLHILDGIKKNMKSITKGEPHKPRNEQRDFAQNKRKFNVH